MNALSKLLITLPIFFAVAACSSSGTRTEGKYVLSDLTLSDGSVFSPRATPDSSCEAQKAEIKRVEMIMGPDQVAYANRGKGELGVLHYLASMTEGHLFKCSELGKKLQARRAN